MSPGGVRRRQAATWQHRVVLEAEQQFPGASSAAWQRTGERFDQFTDTGRSSRRITRTLSDRARALSVAAERPEPPAPPGLVKRLFEWVRERVQKMLRGLRPSKAADRQDRSPGGDVEPARAPTAAERAQQEQRQARDADHGRPAPPPAGGETSRWPRRPSSLSPSRSRPAGDIGGSPSGPRTDQGGRALVVSHKRVRRTETPLPRREGRGGRPAPSAGPQGVGGPIMDAPPNDRTTETRASRSAQPS